MTFTFDDNYPSEDLFEVNGASMVTGMTITVTGIDELLGSNSVVLYPNPSDKMVNIKSTKVMKQITLINHVGQVIFTRNVDDNLYQFDVSVLASGIYTVRIETGDHTILIKRLSVR